MSVWQLVAAVFPVLVGPGARRPSYFYPALRQLAVGRKVLGSGRGQAQAAITSRWRLMNTSAGSTPDLFKDTPQIWRGGLCAKCLTPASTKECPATPHCPAGPTNFGSAHTTHTNTHCLWTLGAPALLGTNVHSDPSRYFLPDWPS